MARMIRSSQLMQPPNTSAAGIPFWDLAAVAIAVEPEVCSDWQDLAIRIVLDPDNVAGQTVVENGAPPNAHICLGGHQSVFENILSLSMDLSTT